MAATYVRFSLLALACLIAHRADAQDGRLPSYSSYAPQGISYPVAQGPYGQVPAPPAYSYSNGSPAAQQPIPYGTYPTTQRSAPQYAYPAATSPPAQPAFNSATAYPFPNASYNNSDQSAAYGGAAYGGEGGMYQPVAPPSQAYPQYASIGGGVEAAPVAPPIVQPTPVPTMPVPSEQYPNYPDEQHLDPSALDSSLAGCDQFGCATPKRKFFVTYDLLYWTISPPKTSLIGNTQLEGDYTRGGVTTHVENSLNTSFIDFEFDTGHRVEFGCRDCYDGWLVGFAYGEQTHGLTSNSVNFLPRDPGFPNLAQSYLAGYSDGNGDSIDDDINGNNFFGRFGEDIGTPDGMGGFVAPTDGTPDVPGPTDTGDLQIYLPVFSEASVRNKVTLSNLEVMYMTRMHGQADSDFEFLYGVRYLDLEDFFAFHGTGGTLDATSVSVTSENQLVGLQVGARWQKCFGPWFLNAEGRFLASANMQDNKLHGNVASNILTTSNGQNGPVNLSPQAFNATSSNNEWAPLGEFRVQAILPINACTAFRLGYTGFVAGGISRASQKVDYVLPRFGLNQSASNETVVFNAFNIGFEINR